MNGCVRGFGLLDALATLGVLAVTSMAMLPYVVGVRGSVLTAAGAWRIATVVEQQRWKAVAESRAHGLRFVQDARGWSWSEVRDGNGNGLRTSEVVDGTDPTLSGPQRLEDTVHPVRLGFPPGRAIPKIPPGKGSIERLDDPIRIGNTSLLAFGPLGGSTSGTLYLTDGRQTLYAVVLFGRTGRVRVWRYAWASGRWSY